MKNRSVIVWYFKRRCFQIDLLKIQYIKPLLNGKLKKKTAVNNVVCWNVSRRKWDYTCIQRIFTKDSVLKLLMKLMWQVIIIGVDLILGRFRQTLFCNSFIRRIPVSLIYSVAYLPMRKYAQAYKKNKSFEKKRFQKWNQ
jgi:hypothetical protein